MSKKKIEILEKRSLHLERQMVIIFQILQNHRLIKINQNGSITPLFQTKDNPMCKWVTQNNLCKNTKCEWYNGPCIFSGYFQDCNFFKEMGGK